MGSQFLDSLVLDPFSRSNKHKEDQVNAHYNKHVSKVNDCVAWVVPQIVKVLIDGLFILQIKTIPNGFLNINQVECDEAQ